MPYSKMKIYEFFPIFILTVYSTDCQDTDGLHPDFYLNTTEIIQKYGYPVETHEVTTEDGYILTMFRISHGRQGSGINRKPVLLMHGLFGQGENYIVAGMYNASVAYILADNGFDVWIGNTRGTQHCRRHMNLSPKSKEFWMFSYHEIGLYDLSAIIDYILSIRNKDKLYYVGHSQGGTLFYILTSLKPEYQKKIVIACLLAPGGYFRNFRNPFLLSIVKILKTLEKMAEIVYELPPSSIPFAELASRFCEIKTFRDICQLFYNLLVGYDSGEVPKILLPVALKFISSASSRQPLHYAQAIASGHFRPWDYGEKKNLEKYGYAEPPDYPVKEIKVPVAMFYGKGDTLAYPKDVEQMCEDLPNCVRKFLMPNPKFTHADFLLSRNLKNILMEPLLNLIAEEYDDGS